jgi:hypothetical protein
VRRSATEARLDRREALKRGEEAGEVADSMDVRRGLIRRMEAGELTLDEVQRELKRIKRAGKAAGKLTRDQVWRRS